MTLTKETGLWLAIGFAGQAIFTARFLVQWAASEKERNSVIPVAFWWLSLLGGAILLAYASHKRDQVIVVGQSMGVFVYVRNLMLVRKARRRALRKAGPLAPAATPHEARRGRVMADAQMADNR